MYTYFKQDYSQFQQMTLYPKIEYGITNMNARPWDITHSGIGLTTLERFLDFKVVNWENVKNAILHEPRTN